MGLSWTILQTSLWLSDAIRVHTVSISLPVGIAYPFTVGRFFLQLGTFSS